MTKEELIPEQIQALIRGFQESRVVLTALELDVWNAVGDGATAPEVARKIEADSRATESLLNALAAIQMLGKDRGVFHNTPLTARFLVQGSPEDSRSAFMHVVHLWRTWSTLTECVKKGTSVSQRPVSERSPEVNRAFIAAMHRNASARAGLVAATLDLSGVKRVLDLGAGSGAYTMALLRKKPELQITAFDLPAIIPLTRQYLAEAGMDNKISTLEGDMSADPIGQGYDLVLISAICHMWSPDENLALLTKIFGALNPGGRIVIQDFILDDDKTSPRIGVLFALNMLVNTKAGSAYSQSEYREWLARAGFTEPRVVELPGPTGLVIAIKA